MSETRESKESDAPGSSKISDKLESMESDAPGSSNMPNTRKRKATDEPESSNHPKSTTDDGGDSDVSEQESIDLPDGVGRKVFNDPVHGHIKLHPLCVKIIDTPEFQRLRFIKQLGGAYLVYPGAAHNRFEHSIGVCHLAGRLLRALKSRLKPDIINEEDILCVEIAGLCHDLGHGPFSHLFDELVIPAVRGENEEKWKHEDGSVQMFERIFTHLAEEFSKAGLDESDKKFIKMLIKVPDNIRSEDWKDKKLQERIEKKYFLFQIVSNKESGVDVDKWDYFARDSLMTGNKTNFDHNRTIAFATILPDKDGVKHICFRDKEADCLFDMFNARYLLHRRVCYHRVTTAVQLMIADALIEAINSKSNDVKFKGERGNPHNLKEARLDMIAYSKITDEILLQIYRSEDHYLEKARDIVDRIFRRKLYHLVGSKIFDHQYYRVIGQDQRTIHEMAKEEITSKCDKETTKEIAVYVAKFDYGKGEHNPLDNVRFFTKKEPIAKQLKDVETHVSTIFRPTKFSEQQVLVYCRSDDKKMQRKVKEIYDKWSDTFKP